MELLRGEEPRKGPFRAIPGLRDLDFHLRVMYSLDAGPVDRSPLSPIVFYQQLLIKSSFLFKYLPFRLSSISPLRPILIFQKAFHHYYRYGRLINSKAPIERLYYYSITLHGPTLRLNLDLLTVSSFKIRFNKTLQFERSKVLLAPSTT
jgi:hypothetical protein